MRGRIKLFEEVGRRLVERGAKSLDAQLTSERETGMVPGPRSVCLFVEIVEACARPERMICAYSESAGIHGEGDCVCGIGLKLHGIYARICGRE